MSETPICDANEKIFFSSISGIKDESRNYVPIKVAREIEMFMNSAKADAENYRKMLAEVEQIRDNWKAEAMRNQTLVERLVAAQR